MFSQLDSQFLSRAVDLAASVSQRSVSPNPRVGAVIVREQEVLGEGLHESYGSDHAEVMAIKAAADSDLVGATLYVSLEPCCHHGRTPPCTEAVIQAGISRVVIASDDPSAHASGQGIKQLRDAGIAIVYGDDELRVQAEKLNQPFRKRAVSGKTHVVYKSALSLDGKVATRSGDSRWISSEQSRQLVHAWRADLDAVAVGIGTVLQDDPLLTARIEGKEEKNLIQPQRVIFDSNARLPVSSQLIRTIEQAPITAVVSEAAKANAVKELEQLGVKVITALGGNRAERIGSALEQLAQQGVSALLLEGGPRLAGAFLAADEVDEIRFFIAPLIIGDAGAPGPVAKLGVEDRVSTAIQVGALSSKRSGSDILIESTLRKW